MMHVTRVMNLTDKSKFKLAI